MCTQHEHPSVAFRFGITYPNFFIDSSGGCLKTCSGRLADCMRSALYNSALSPGKAAWICDAMWGAIGAANDVPIEFRFIQNRQLGQAMDSMTIHLLNASLISL